MSALDDAIRAGCCYSATKEHPETCEYPSKVCGAECEAPDNIRASLRHLASHVTETQVEAAARAITICDGDDPDEATGIENAPVLWMVNTDTARVAIAAYWADVLGESDSNDNTDTK